MKSLELRTWQWCLGNTASMLLFSMMTSGNIVDPVSLTERLPTDQDGSLSQLSFYEPTDPDLLHHGDGSGTDLNLILNQGSGTIQSPPLPSLFSFSTPLPLPPPSTARPPSTLPQSGMSSPGPPRSPPLFPPPPFMPTSFPGQPPAQPRTVPPLSPSPRTTPAPPPNPPPQPPLSLPPRSPTITTCLVCSCPPPSPPSLGTPAALLTPQTQLSGPPPPYKTPPPPGDVNNAVNSTGILLTANFAPSGTTGASGTAFLYLPNYDGPVYLYIGDLMGVKSPLTVSLLSSITTTPVAVITANSVPAFSAPTGLSLAGKLAMSKSDRDELSAFPTSFLISVTPSTGSPLIGRLLSKNATLLQLPALLAPATYFAASRTGIVQTIVSAAIAALPGALPTVHIPLSINEYLAAILGAMMPTIAGNNAPLPPIKTGELLLTSLASLTSTGIATIGYMGDAASPRLSNILNPAFSAAVNTYVSS